MSWACPVQDARGSPHTQFKRETKSANDRRPHRLLRLHVVKMLRVEPLPRQGLAGPGTAVNLHTQFMANLAAPYMVNSSHANCENDKTHTDPSPPSLLH